jgi:hypothetical protein
MNILKGESPTTLDTTTGAVPFSFLFLRFKLLLIEFHL